MIGRFAIAVLGSALFGAAVGCYVGRLQILFAAVKMPLFLLGTLAVSFPALHLFALVAAPTLRRGETFALALDSVTRTAMGLGALAPIVAFLSWTTPIPSYRTYLFLVLGLTGSIALAGVVSLRRLWTNLRGARHVFFAWVSIYGFTGSQIAWLLRPWVGSSYEVRGSFSIHRNLEGNFYEAVVRSVARLLF